MLPEVWALQVAPPSVVARTVPFWPTTQPWLTSLKATELSSCEVPEVCVAQVAPPSVVARMVPPSPTAQPREASAKATPRRWTGVPDSCAVQPPSPGGTMRNNSGLSAVPRGVVMCKVTIATPAGTVAVISLSETTVKAVADVVPKLTWVAPVKPAPVMVTMSPGMPHQGETSVTVGAARPPVVVATIVPSSPATQARVGPALAMPRSVAPVPERCRVHVAPPSVVPRMVPGYPTAQP